MLELVIGQLALRLSIGRSMLVVGRFAETGPLCELLAEVGALKESSIELRLLRSSLDGLLGSELPWLEKEDPDERSDVLVRTGGSRR